MNKVIKLKCYNSVSESTTLFTIQDGEKYYVDPEYGFVDFFFTEEKAIKHINDELKVPFAEITDELVYFYIYEIDGYFGLYDDNFHCYTESLDIWSLLSFIDYNTGFPQDKFPSFCFPKSWETEEDYDGGEFYDAPPSYYDPRYDGPMHYIPPGNH